MGLIGIDKTHSLMFVNYSIFLNLKFQWKSTKLVTIAVLLTLSPRYWDDWSRWPNPKHEQDNIDATCDWSTVVIFFIALVNMRHQSWKQDSDIFPWNFSNKFSRYRKQMQYFGNLSIQLFNWANLCLLWHKKKYIP